MNTGQPKALIAEPQRLLESRRQSKIRIFFSFLYKKISRAQYLLILIFQSKQQHAFWRRRVFFWPFMVWSNRILTQDCIHGCSFPVGRSITWERKQLGAWRLWLTPRSCLMKPASRFRENHQVIFQKQQTKPFRWSQWAAWFWNDPAENIRGTASGRPPYSVP